MSFRLFLLFSFEDFCIQWLIRGLQLCLLHFSVDLFLRLYCGGGSFVVPGGGELFFLSCTEAFLGRGLRFLPPCAEGRLVDPFSLVVPDGSLQGHPAPLHIDFELQLVIIGEGHLKLMANSIVLFELSHQLIHTQFEITQLVVLAIFTLNCQQAEFLLASLHKIGQVEVQPAAADGHHMPTSYQLEISLNGYLILIESLMR